MFNFRTFSRSRDPSEARFASTGMDLVASSDEQLVFEAVVHSGPFRGKTVTLAYEGDFAVDGEAVFGAITQLSVSIDGRTHFEIIPKAPIDVDDFDDFLDDVSDLLDDRGEDDEDDDDDESDDDEESDDDDEEDEDEDDEIDDDDADDADDPEGADLADLGDLGAVREILAALWGGGFAFRGGRRDDDFDGDDGDDEMDGGEGDDALHGGRGRDRLDGGEGDDALAGGGGRDVLRGGRGHDDLDGGRGGDVLNGGAGADTFVFADLDDLGVGVHRDVVRGLISGRDRIDLSGIDANLGRDGDQRFRFVGDDGLSGRSGDLCIADGVLSGDLDGDGATDFEIRLGRASVDADDFVL